MACKMNVQFLVLLVLAAVAQEQLATASKFAYTKPLYGKSNFVKEKRFKLRATSTTPAAAAVAATAPTTTTSTTSTTTTTTEAAWPSSVEFIINTSPKTRTATESADASIESTSSSKGISTSSSSSSTFSPSISSFTTTPSTVHSSSTVAADVEFDMEPGSSSSASNTITTTVNSTTPSSLDNTLPSPPTPATTTTTVAPTEAADNQPVPCTCGVFLSSQIRNALPEKPLIHNEMDRMYPCNAIGRKQCQTKCLEAIVQHLPNSANIVCATLGHNCHKERAYLFIKNCHNQWVNTKLQAGREYCCKEGTPYRCPLLG